VPDNFMLKLGLTGGIGSGKSTVAALLAELGAEVVDADAISRSTTSPGGSALPRIRELFGEDFINSDGSLHRDRMREKVFADPQAKSRLEHIIHPLVGQAIAERSAAAEERSVKCLVYDIPLLVESAHWRTRLDRVLIVDCPEEIQVERVMQRSGLSREAIEKIIRAQANRLQRAACADAVIFNNGNDLDILKTRVRQCGAYFGL